MVLALAAIQRGDYRRFRVWIMATALFGATFIAGQIYEFTEFTREGLTLDTNLFGSSFFVLTGLHGAHVTVGIVWLLSLWGLSMQGRLTQARLRAGRDRRALLALRRRRLDRDLHRHLPDPEVGGPMTDSERRGRRGRPPSTSPSARSSAPRSDLPARDGARRRPACCRASSGRTPTPVPVRDDRGRCSW